MHLSDKALLAHLGVSQWMGRKQDAKASKQITDMHAANPKAYSATKYLLPTCSDLKALHTKTAEVRKQFYRNTLPWGIDGTFILPSGNYLEFMTYFRGEKDSWEQLLNRFLAKYEDAISEARSTLGTAFISDEYPSVNSIRQKFRMEITILPVPTAGDFRVELSDAEREHVAAEFDSTAIITRSIQLAVQDVWSRLHEHVAWFVDRLSDPKNVFKDQGFETAKSTIDLLERLNFTNDPDLEALRREVAEKLTSHNPDNLRYDPDVRRQAAEDAQSIMERMGPFMRGLSA